MSEANRKRSLDQLKQELRNVAEAVKRDNLRKRSLSSMGVRRERLDYILELFKENPSLAVSEQRQDTSYSRLPSLIAKRQQLWESITEKVNKKFAMKLEEITVEQVKKNMLYAKKREEGNYDNIKDLVIPDQTDNLAIVTPRHLGLNYMNVKMKFENESRESTPEESESEYPYSVSQTSLTPEHQNRLNYLLNNEVHNNTNSSKSKFKTDRKLAKVRAAFITDKAEYYIQRLCLDTTARSMAVNIERNNMWIKIVQKTNDNFSGILPPIGIEQAKKQYSNYKARDRPKSEGAHSSYHDENESKQSIKRTTRSLPNVPFVKIENIEPISPADHPMGDISIQPKIESFEQFRMQLNEKDAQIKMLEKKIEEQAREYTNRVNIMMEMVRASVNKSTQEEITRAIA